ncbi:hypothetical protein ABEV34_24745 [Methylorubrum rhodesianum]|uniref:Uncharacterized protein n=1 Tax=Methylorubrum rhodesianum TaxID=29427 RepID=A0ABU9ZFW9_9HYPH|nr:MULTISPECIES: hypothetical protein [Methylorubrum]MBB5765617.1 hypothetical protein [Methylorubrum rhodesianum]MBI1691874.1 hypothetical protein [Methylorubrum sp. DB1722]MBK3401223.1 hypothetical protein [Methylorubrum rhodesianum]MBY0142186.1 hypothetical protein [Methylorubrum populi]
MIKRTIKRTGLAVLLGLGGFALGSGIARVTEKAGAGPVGAAEAPPALRHITQFPPPPAPDKPAKDSVRSGR